MRTLDKYGYASLLIGLICFYILSFKMLGLFFQGMALGFFIKSALGQINK